MKTWLNSKTGQRLPAKGCISSCSLVTRGAQAGKRVEIWDQGEGRRIETAAKWREEDVPDLAPGFSVSQYRAYVAAYGPHCAMEHIHTCDYMKPIGHRDLMNPAMPGDEDLSWFQHTFGAGFRSFLLPIGASLGVVMFDIVSFEDHLAKSFGYPAHLGTLSMADFLKQRFGGEVLGRFTRIALHS